MKRVLKYLTFYDKVLIIVIMSLSIIFILYPFFINWNVFSGTDQTEEKNQYVIIQVADEVVEKVPLDQSREDSQIIEVDGEIGVSIIEIDRSKVRVKEAPENDPLRICEKTGWINSPGPSIICIPNQLTIWIENIEEENEDLDGVSW